jgi:retinol dehydrogenase 12
MFPAPMGAITPAYAMTSPDLARSDSGQFFNPWARRGTPARRVQDIDLAMKLWEYLERDVERFGIAQAM